VLRSGVVRSFHVRMGLSYRQSDTEVFDVEADGSVERPTGAA
jgi:hypothetical protein